MRKYALFLLLLLLGATPLYAQTQDRGGPGDLGSPPGSSDSDPFGTPSTSPDPGDRGALDPCPPGSTPPDLNQGDRGGLGDSELDQRSLPPPGSIPPNPPGSVPSNPPGSTPPNPQGSLPGDQGGSLGQPDAGNSDQFGMTDCPPSGTDRGGLGQGGLDSPSGQDLPGSERRTPPPLLPPSGGVQ